MKIDILSLFPEMYNGPFSESIIKRAQNDKKIEKNYKKYGFESLYTPIIENAEVFHGFHGEGEKL